MGQQFSQDERTRLRHVHAATLISTKTQAASQLQQLQLQNAQLQAELKKAQQELKKASADASSAKGEAETHKKVGENLRKENHQLKKTFDPEYSWEHKQHTKDVAVAKRSQVRLTKRVRAQKHEPGSFAKKTP